MWALVMTRVSVLMYLFDLNNINNIYSIIRSAHYNSNKIIY